MKEKDIDSNVEENLNVELIQGNFDYLNYNNMIYQNFVDIEDDVLDHDWRFDGNSYLSRFLIKRVVGDIQENFNLNF